ncbi:MAG: tripartite tricarboxylate transporter substrate binding protein [Betaproteobacteria bacterium]|nr:tripartite tricarboxylate transporter substrate binding protein [Betaproteobacteria bacterium]
MHSLYVRFILAVCFALPLASQPARAQIFPSRPLIIIVPFAAGGTLDAVTRIVAQKMTENLGQPVVVDNRTGAGGIIGFSAAAKAKPDGHTLVTVANSFAVNPAVRSDLPYDAAKDFVPVTSLGSTPHLLVVPASLPAATLRELIALAAQKPEGISYGTLGDGSYSHLVGKLLEKAAGVKLLQIPFRGSAPTVAAVVGEQISMAFANLPEVMPHVRAGRLRALAIARPMRSPLAPDIPTVSELGYPGFVSESWYGLVAPAGTPADIIERLQREVARALALPDVKERLQGQGVAGGGETAAQFAVFLREQMTIYAAIVREANIRVNAN